jgi:serine/threonine protein phosphatase 1
MAGRLIIGDIQGQLSLLKGMLEDVKVEDVLIVGDLIDKGNKNIETLKFVKEKGYKMVIGNHKKLMLNFLISNNAETKKSWFDSSGKQTYNEFVYKTSKQE